MIINKLEKIFIKLQIWLMPLAVCCMFWALVNLPVAIIPTIITFIYYIVLIVYKIKHRKEKIKGE